MADTQGMRERAAAMVERVTLESGLVLAAADVKVLRSAVDATTGLSRTPAPGIQFTGFGPNSLDFEVVAFAPDFESSGGLRSELASRIYAALDEAGIRIPVPRQELQLVAKCSRI